MVDKILTGTRFFSDDDGLTMRLDYYCTKVIEEKQENSPNTFYGVEISLIQENGESKEISRDCEYYLTDCFETNQGILDRLIYFSVTPTSFIEVIDDICQYAADI